jgi:hypothetical protein
MLRLEISQASINKCSVETKTKLTDDLFRLLQVREKNKDMAKDWLLFLTTSKFNKITPGEIYMAFKMAMSRELVDKKGNEIDMLPELSNNTTGKVLEAYLRYKLEDSAYGLAKDKLKQLALPDFQEPSEEQKQRIRDEFLMNVFISLSTISNKKWRKSNPEQLMYCTDAWLLYTDVQDRLQITDACKKRLYKWQNSKHMKELEREVASSGNKAYHRQLLESYQKSKDLNKSAVIQNRCRSIVVSNYLKKYIADFETFKNAINK